MAQAWQRNTGWVYRYAWSFLQTQASREAGSTIDLSPCVGDFDLQPKLLPKMRNNVRGPAIRFRRPSGGAADASRSPAAKKRRKHVTINARWTQDSAATDDLVVRHSYTSTTKTDGKYEKRLDSDLRFHCGACSAETNPSVDLRMGKTEENPFGMGNS